MNLLAVGFAPVVVEKSTTLCRRTTMPEKTYKIIDIVGVSDDSVQQAVRNALKKASQTVRNIDWFEVTEIRGLVHNNSEPVFQVSIKLGFRLEGQPV
jgi:dodecin